MTRCWIIATFCLLAVRLAAGENLAPNPGFEAPDPAHPETPAGWQRTDWGNAVELTVSTQGPHGGQRAVMIQARPGQAATEACWSTPWGRYEERIKVKPGHIYRVSAWIRRAQADDKAFLWIVGYDRGQKDLDGKEQQIGLTFDGFADHGPAGQWNRIEKNLDIPPNIDSLSLRCRFKRLGPVWFDDLVLEDQAPDGRVACLVDPEPSWAGSPEQPRQAVGVKLFNATVAPQHVTVGARCAELGDQTTQTLDLQPGEDRKLYLGLENRLGRAVGEPAIYQLEIRHAQGVINETMTMRVETPPTRLTARRTLLVPHFHGDPFWFKNQEHFIDLGLDITRATMDVMAKDPDYNGILAELPYLVPFYTFFPQYRDKLREYFANGRCEGSGAYNEPNERDATLEALARNILYGKLFHEDVLGGRTTVSQMLDNFGQIPQWPQLVAKAGFTGCIWGRGNPFCDTSWPALPKTLDWMSPDGSRITLSREGYWKYVDLSVSDVLPQIERENAGHRARGYDNLAFGMIGCDWTYPNQAVTQYARDRREGTGGLVSPVVAVNGPREYFKWVADQQAAQPNAPLPLATRDMSIFHMGTSVARTDLNIGERLAENRAVQAETWAAIANLLGAPYPDRMLDKAWRHILYAQHHDSRTASDGAFYSILNCLHEALDLSERARQGALGRISENIRVAPGVAKGDMSKADIPTNIRVPLVVFNSLSWDRQDVCEAEVAFPEGRRPKAFQLEDAARAKVPSDLLESERDGEGRLTRCRISFVAGAVPSVGYRTYYAVAADGPQAEPASEPAADTPGTAIDNEFYRIEVSPELGGGVTQIYDKRAGREVLPPAANPLRRDTTCLANEIIGLIEVGNTPYDITTIESGMQRSRNYPATVRRVQGRTFEKLTVTVTSGTLGPVTQEITLHRGVGRIDFKTTLGYPANPNLAYVVSFPSAIAGAVGVFDEKAGAIARDASPTSYAFRTGWDKNECGLYSSNQWIEKGYAALFSFVDARGAEQASYAPGLCEVRFADNAPPVRRLTDALQLALARKGLTCTPAFDSEDTTTDLKYRRTRLWLGLTSEPGPCRRLVDGLDGESRAAYEVQLAAQGCGFLFIKDPSATAELDSKILLIGARDQAGLERAVGRIIEDLKTGAEIKLAAAANRCLGPGKVDRYGLALINIGRAANSLERNGALCQVLGFSPDYHARELKDFMILPEEKQQVFEYSLYPHAGSWREANTARAGWERNVSLTCAQKTSDSPGANLPETLSFARVEGERGSVMLSTLKPRTVGPAAFLGKLSDVRDGLVIRLVELNGETTGPVKVELFKGLKSVTPASLIERPQGAPLAVEGRRFTCAVGANAIETFLAAPDGLAPSTGAGYDLAEEDATPLYARFWKHNDGEAALGNNLVTPVLQGKLELGQTSAITAWVVNSYRDQSAAGRAVLGAPAGWSIEPSQFDYNLAPGATERREIKVTIPATGPGGWLRLRSVCGKVMLEDALKAGPTRPLEARCAKAGDALLVTLANPNDQAVDGVISASTPLEAWGEALAGDFARASLAPWRQAFHLEAQTTQTLRFAVKMPGKSPTETDAAAFARRFWAVFKVSHDGENLYLAAPKDRDAALLDYDALARTGVRLEKFFEWKSSEMDGLEILSIANGHCAEIYTSHKPPKGVESRFLASPPAGTRVALKIVQGRGKVRLIQQPDAGNGQTVLISLDDKDPGPAPYAFELYACSGPAGSERQ